MLNYPFVKKLQAKPEPQKMMIMWATAVIIMALIFIFWLWNFSNQIGQSQEQSQAVTAPDTSQLPSAWASFKSEAGSAFNLLKNINLNQ